MKVIIPKITDLIASNITEPLTDWAVGTAYVAGDKAYVLISDFDDLITDGDCFSASFTGDGAEWAHNPTTSAYDCDASQAGNSKLYQTVQASKVVSGDKYLVQFEITTYTAGNVAGYVGGTSGANVAVAGYYQQEIVAGSTDAKIGVIADLNFDGSISNVLVKKLGGNVQKDIYESQTGQTGNFPPPDDFTNWVRREASNRWKMFDDYTSTQTELIDIIHVKVDSSKCDALALFNTEGTTSRIIVTENSTNYAGTSADSITIGTGAKSFPNATVGKLWVADDKIEIESDADPLKFMVGTVTSYNSTTGALVVNVTSVQSDGSGPYTDWSIRYVWVNTTHAFTLSESLSWSDYFFTEIRFSDSNTQEFNLSFDTSCRVIITGATSQIIRCGHMIVGNTRALGSTQPDISVSLSDYSVKETNTYGETYLSQGAYAQNMSFDFYVESGGTDQVYQTIAQLRAIPCAWDSNENDSDLATLVSYGVYDGFTELIRTPTYTIVSLDIKGLT